jgi:hypothetical protein
MRVHAKYEAHVGLVIPSVKKFGLREVGVASQDNLLKAGLSAESNGLIEISMSLFMRGPRARSVDYE